MDIELLRTFLEVSRTRHFGKAAEGMFLTQAAVSARIKSLEELLGVKLFIRDRRDIKLTPGGNRLISRADRLISEWRKVRQEISAGGATKQISVGGSLRLWDVILQQWLVRMRSAEPELALIAESHTPDLLTRKLLDGVLDLAFMLEPPQLEVLQIRDIGGLSLRLVSSQANHDLESALADGYLMVDWGLTHALQHRRLFPDAPEPQTRLASGSLTLHYLLQLGGSAYLPDLMVQHHVDVGKLFWVGDAPQIDHRIHAVYPVRSGRLELIDMVLNYFDLD
ncbi:MAG: LysR family transcriptional regulator [Gammaproteobacteria bacterium]|nr:LysR family transcriptional regulator [Gammaproteobacteria bacterium]